MVYLVIKELSKIAEDVIMVTSSIMKDMQPNLEVIYRPNAIRALARIIDVRAFSAPLVLQLTIRRNQFNPSRDTSKPLSLTDPPPSLPHLSFRPTISITSHPLSSSDGLTKLRKPSMPKPCPHLHSPAHPHTSREAVRGVIKQSLHRATSCNTTLLDCCT